MPGQPFESDPAFYYGFGNLKRYIFFYLIASFCHLKIIIIFARTAYWKAMETKPAIKIMMGAGLALVLNACAVSNNLYMNDATPYEKGNGSSYLGIGSGLAPRLDSVSSGGKVYYTNRLSIMPNLCAGAQGHLKNNLSGRLSLNFPFIIGGIGIRGGLQYSFLPATSKFNIALGGDLGFVLSRDSIRIWGSSNALNPEVAGITSADLFMPFTIQMNDHSRLTITPRLSTQAFWIRHNVADGHSYSYSPTILGVSGNIKIRQTNMEMTILKVNGVLMPSLGVSRSWAL